MSFLIRKSFARYSILQMTKDFRYSTNANVMNLETEESPLKSDRAARLERQRRLSRAPKLSEIRHVYPEFLPDPIIKHRNRIREKLERMDMINRRTQIDIPEFYVGSIVAISYSDPHNQGKTNRFVGICIERGGCGLRAFCVLRNVVDHIGTEINFLLYDPTLEKVQVLRLEKRLDDTLYYLRDAPEIYSTFSFDMEPEIPPDGSEVPVNPLVIPMKPRPWTARWERKGFKGVENLDVHLTPKMIKQKIAHERPWEKYDLMKIYRNTIYEEDQSEIWSEVQNQLHQMEIQRKKQSRKKVIVLPKKSG